MDLITEREKVKKILIRDLGFSEEVVEALINSGYKTIGDIEDLSVNEFMSIEGIGKIHCLEIVNKLIEMGVKDNNVDLYNEQGEYWWNIEKRFPYPMNLIAAMKEIDMVDILGLKESIELVLDTLTDREKTMILLRFEKMWTFEKIGNSQGLSGERVRQIIQKALRKLRHPARYRKLFSSLRFIDELAADKAKELLVDEYMRGYNDGITDVDIVYIEEDSIVPEKFFSIPLKYLDLSENIYQRLNNRGVHSVGDVLNIKSHDIIIDFFRLSFESAREVAVKLRKYRVYSFAWDYFLENY